jgi:hypothetical protein
MFKRSQGGIDAAHQGSHGARRYLACATKKSAISREASKSSGAPGRQSVEAPGQVCQPPVTTCADTVEPPAHVQLVVVDAPSVTAEPSPPQPSWDRHTAITSAIGE